MKFAKILIALTAAVASVVSQEEPEKLNFSVDYSIVEFPEITANDVAEIKNGEPITLQYSFENKEAEEVSIIGVGGSLIDAEKMSVAANLTNSAIGPLALAPGSLEVFRQKVNMDLVPSNYILVPHVYVSYNGETRLVQVRGQQAYVDDVAISFFNPQLLLLEAVLVATFGFVAYVVYNIWGKKYIQRTAPNSKPIKVASPSAAATALDSSWIPESHLKQKKSKKAY